MKQHRITIYDPAWCLIGSSATSLARAVQNGQALETETGGAIYPSRRTGAPAGELMADRPLFGLKLFELDGGRLYSTYYPKDGSMPMAYEVGSEVTQRPGPCHTGGLYFYLTTNLTHFLAAFRAGYIISPARGQRWAVARVQAWGPFYAYDVHGRMLGWAQLRQAKKMAANRLLIGAVIKEFTS